MSAAVNDAIDRLTGHQGFWHSSTKGRLRQVARDLAQQGLGERVIIDTITQLWAIVSNEYGE